jgi:hypothetical protein
MRAWSILIVLFCVMCFSSITEADYQSNYVKVPQNLTKHSWIYFQGYMDDMEIYQTEPGYAGQKLVAGTRGTGTISRTQSAEVYGSTPAITDPKTGKTIYQQGDNDVLSFNEWGVISNNRAYNPTLTQNDLKNALCAKNYEVGSVFSESYSNIRQLVKDTDIYQDKRNSVYQIGSYASGTTKLGSRIQKNYNTIPIYTMGGVYEGDLNVRMTIETGDSSVLTIPCP